MAAGEGADLLTACIEQVVLRHERRIGHDQLLIFRGDDRGRWTAGRFWHNAAWCCAHVNHGIGRYQGLVNIDIGEGASEFLHLEYADKATLYVPVAQLHLIGRYTGVSAEEAPLHKLGSGQWEKARRKAAEQVRDTAAELLNLYALRAAREGFAHRFSAHDYEAFVRSELPIREALLYPPYGHVIRLVVRGIDEDRVAAWAGTLVDRLRAEAGNEAGIRVLGPAPAPIARLRERFRWHLQIHGPDGPLLRGLVGRATARLKTPDGIAWIVDVDPVEML